MAMLAALCSDSLSAFVPGDRLFCLHVEHGLRPAKESQGDAEFVRDFCKKQKISCRIESIPQGEIASLARNRGMGIEATARFFRRRALLEEAGRIACQNGNVFILTAHTKDDMLETVLMRVLRGTGPAGLAAMPVRRGQFLRPLLSMSRADVIGYLNEKNVSWREDSTNKDEKYLRNKIRCSLVPLLNEYFPAWKKGLTGMAETQALAAEFFFKEAQRNVCWDIQSGECTTDEANFFYQPEIIREEALFIGINALSSLRVPVPLSGEFRSHSIKRAVIRKFCSGLVNAADLGELRVKRKSGKINLSFVQLDFLKSEGENV